MVMAARLMKLRLYNQLRMFKICHDTRVWAIYIYIVTCFQLKSAAISMHIDHVG